MNVHPLYPRKLETPESISAMPSSSDWTPAYCPGGLFPKSESVNREPSIIKGWQALFIQEKKMV